MSEQFDDEDKSALTDELFEQHEPIVEDSDSLESDARRRVERLLEERRLRSELDDFFENDK